MNDATDLWTGQLAAACTTFLATATEMEIVLDIICHLSVIQCRQMCYFQPTPIPFDNAGEVCEYRIICPPHHLATSSD